MAKLFEQCIANDAYNLYVYQVEEETGNSKQTLFWFYANKSVPAPQTEQWCVLCGEWEASSFSALAAALLLELDAIGQRSKTVSVKGSVLQLQAIDDDGWKLYVNFLEQEPLIANHDSRAAPRRWRIYVGSIEAMKGLLRCASDIQERPMRLVTSNSKDWYWLVPRGVELVAASRFLQPRTLRSLQTELEEHCAGVPESDDARVLLEKVRSRFQRDVNQEVASCLDCGTDFVRSSGASWKKRCLKCYAGPATTAAH